LDQASARRAIATRGGAAADGAGAEGTVTSADKLTPEALYYRLRNLIATMPDLGEQGYEGALPSETQVWLGRAHAVLNAAKMTVEAIQFEMQSSNLSGASAFRAAQEISSIPYRALAWAEMRAPIEDQGAFIPVGNTLDTLASIGRILSGATKDVLIIDPYLDEKVITEFAVFAAGGAHVRLLADERSVKPTLAPAHRAWTKQYGTGRPLVVRLAAPGSLHDRAIIVDRSTAWSLTQSLKDFAARSPATITRIDAETAGLKIAAYEAIWATSSPQV